MNKQLYHPIKARCLLSGFFYFKIFQELFGRVVKGGIFDAMKESFKIDSEIKKRLGKQAKLTGRTITGLAELILDKQLTTMESGAALYDECYAYVMAPILGKAIKGSNKKKK